MQSRLPLSDPLKKPPGRPTGTLTIAQLQPARFHPHPYLVMADSFQLLRPTPRRAFEMTPVSGSPISPPTPSPTGEIDDAAKAEPSKVVTEEPSPSRTRSILNLTSSTLFGIYAPSDDASTPWGNGSQTPTWRPSLDDKRPPPIGAFSPASLPKPHPQHHSALRDTIPSIARRTVLLFLLGVAYGLIIIHLHDGQRLAPVKVEGFERYSILYLTIWGVAGVMLGTLLPWVDTFWGERIRSYGSDLSAREQKGHSKSFNTITDEDERPSSPSRSDSDTDWTPVIRSIGAFIGIAFAIRRLPWQSTLQVSLTLALVNPVLWYLVDRSKPGFILSSVVGLAGTAVSLSINPNLVLSPAPAPSPNANAANILHNSSGYESLISIESIGLSTWIASVLFCSSVCFGNIGRRLAPRQRGRQGSVS